MALLKGYSCVSETPLGKFLREKAFAPKGHLENSPSWNPQGCVYYILDFSKCNTNGESLGFVVAPASRGFLVPWVFSGPCSVTMPIPVRNCVSWRACPPFLWTPVNVQAIWSRLRILEGPCHDLASYTHYTHRYARARTHTRARILR